jgi:hypothetical protein
VIISDNYFGGEYKTRTLKNQFSFRTSSSGKINFYLPNLFYFIEKSDLKNYYFNRLGEIYSLEQFDIKYNRPDKVLQALDRRDTALIASYRAAYEKRIKRLGIDTTSFRVGNSVPEADFKNRNQVEFEQEQEKLTLRITGKDTTIMLDRFNIWINEVPMFGIRGVNLRNKKTYVFDTTLTITLSRGENRIEASINNVNGTESFRMPLYVNYNPVKAPQEKLHFVGIGVNEFAQSQYDLTWSVKDIRDLATAFKKRYGERMYIDTLFNSQVTIATVKALKRKLQNSAVNDKVILVYSGHGLLSKDYDYYLSTYQTNFSDPKEAGLPYETLESLLDSIPSRNKLLLIDACHSGEVDKEDFIKLQGVQQQLEAKGMIGSKGVGVSNQGSKSVGLQSSFELMQELFINVGRSTGATVISAAAGTQFALEKNDLENGVFSYSILEYMKAHSSANVSELKQYVNRRVSELTAGMQVPTTRTEPTAIDWQLW